ncbi:MAG: ABC transporter permease [Deltaproteobacteria bacterium]|nr:ABC transporter permease [Deltaproteobacteria bacterium]
MAAGKARTYILWIAWRHIIARKGHSLSFMTWVSILGVAIGVAALVIVLSVMGGFEQDLKQKMFRGLPHMEILHENAMAGFSLRQHSLKQVRSQFPDAAGIAAFTKADIVLKKKRHLASVSLFGIDPEGDSSLWGFGDSLIQGRLTDLIIAPEAQSHESLPGIILGETLAIKMGAEPGDEVQVLNPQIDLAGALGGGRFTTSFRVVGTFITDLPQYDNSYGVVTLESGRKFLPDYDASLDEDEYVTGIALNMQHPEDVQVFVDRLKGMPELRARTWKHVNKSLLVALKLEKFTMAAILLLIVLVAAFSISGTMMMTVYYRKNQVLLFRSLGMKKSDVIQMFLAHGMTIGTFGVVLGMLTGLAGCSLLYYFQFVNLPAHLYYLQKLPVRFLPLEYVVISLCAWGLSLLAAVYPALVAARQNPGGVLRCL